MDWHPITIHERSPTPTCAVRSGLSGVDRRCHTITRGPGTGSKYRSSSRDVDGTGLHATRGENPAHTPSDQYERSSSIHRVSVSQLPLTLVLEAAEAVEGRVWSIPHSSGESPQRPDSGVSRGEYVTPLSRYATGRDATRDRFESRRALRDASRRRRRLTSSVSQTDHPADSHCIGLGVSKRLWWWVGSNAEPFSEGATSPRSRIRRVSAHGADRRQGPFFGRFDRRDDEASRFRSGVTPRRPVDSVGIASWRGTGSLSVETRPVSSLPGSLAVLAGRQPSRAYRAEI